MKFFLRNYLKILLILGVSFIITSFFLDKFSEKISDSMFVVGAIMTIIALIVFIQKNLLRIYSSKDKSNEIKLRIIPMLASLGFILVILAFIYDIPFLRISSDVVPTYDQLNKGYSTHSTIDAIIALSGFLLLIVGFLGIIAVIILKMVEFVNIQRIKRKRFLGPAFIFTVVLLVIFIVFTKNNKTEAKPPEAVNYFKVVSVSPKANSSENVPDSTIKLTFSEPVRPDSLRSFFTVSPMIPGKFTQGQNPNEVIFTAKYPFGYGKSVKVILNKGFEAISGDKFTSDYTFNFETKILDDQVQFVDHDFINRLVTLQEGEKKDFGLEVGGDVSSNGTITIYKATFDQLVSSLLYKNESHTDSNYITQTYIDYPIDTSKMEKISVTKDIKEESNFSFNQNKGLYYVEAKSNNKAIGSMWVNVDNQKMIIREDDQKIVISTENDIPTTVLLYNLQNKPTLLNVSTIQNYTEIPVQYPQKVDMVVGQTKDGIIIVPIGIPETQADVRVTKNLSNSDKTFLYTDRPTYLANETIKFSGVLREDNDAQYKLPNAGTNVRLWIPDPEASTKNLVNQTVSVNQDGIFSGEITLPESLASRINSNNNLLTLYAKEVRDNSTYFSSSSYTTFEIQTEKPTGTIKIGFDKDKYTKNEDLVAHILATDASGAPLSNQEIKYSIYAKDYYEDDPTSIADIGNYWGEVTTTKDKQIKLDQDGKAEITLDKQKRVGSYAVTLSAESNISGKDLTGAKTTLVQQGNLILAFAPSRQNYKNGDTTINRVYVTDLSGNPSANLNLHYQLYISTYDRTADKYIESILSEGNAKTDNQGFVQINQAVDSKLPDVTMRVTATDPQNNKVQSERHMFIFDESQPSYGLYYHQQELSNLDVATDKLNYKVGDEAHLVVNSPSDQSVLITQERGRIYHSERFALHKGENVYTINITPDLAPSFDLVFSYFDNKSLSIEGVHFNILDSSRKLQLALSQDNNQLKITTKDYTGQPVSANILANFLDENIFMLHNSLPSGNPEWFFNGPRINTTNFSASTLGIGTGGGCGGGSGIDYLYVPNGIGTNIYWSSNLKTDENGELTIKLPNANLRKVRAIIYAVTDNTAANEATLTYSPQN